MREFRVSPSPWYGSWKGRTSNEQTQIEAMNLQWGRARSPLRAARASEHPEAQRRGRDTPPYLRFTESPPSGFSARIGTMNRRDAAGAASGRLPLRCAHRLCQRSC